MIVAIATTTRFHTDEATKWKFDESTFSVGNETLGAFGLPASVLAVSCPEGCRCVTRNGRGAAAGAARAGRTERS